MIKLTKINGEEFVVNCFLIEFVEATPDTMLSLTTGHKLMVRESVDDVIARAVDYQSRVGFLPQRPATADMEQ